MLGRSVRKTIRPIRRYGGRFCSSSSASKKSSSLYPAVLVTALTGGGVVLVGCNLNSSFARKMDSTAPGLYGALSGMGLVPKKQDALVKVEPPSKMPVIYRKETKKVPEEVVKAIEDVEKVEEKVPEKVEIKEEEEEIEEVKQEPENTVAAVVVEEEEDISIPEETTQEEQQEDTTQTVSEAYDLISEVKDKKESLDRLDSVIAAYQAVDPQASSSGSSSSSDDDAAVIYSTTTTTIQQPEQQKQQLVETSETSLLRVHAETLTKTLAAVEDVLQRGVEEETLFSVDTTKPETIESLRTHVRSLRHLLFERSKLEALRLKEALTVQEREITESLENTIRIRLQEEYEKEVKVFEIMLEEQREEHEKKLQSELSNLRRELDVVLEESLERERELGEIKARDARAESLKVHTQRLQETRSRLAKLEDLVNNNIRLKSYKQNSDEVHRLTLASLAFSNDVIEDSSNGKPLGQDLNVLRDVMGDSDELAKRALNMIPEDVKNGDTTVPDWVSLSQRFEVCKKEALGVAYVPSGSTIMGLALSKFTNMLLIRPTADTMYDAETIDCKLERASALLNVGRHLEAWKEVKAVRVQRGETDPVSVVLDAWLEDTRKRLILDQCLKTVHAVNTRMSCMFSS